MVGGLDGEYDKLDDDAKQSVDLWLAGHLAWREVPDTARTFLKMRGENVPLDPLAPDSTPSAPEWLVREAEMAQAETQQALGRIRALALNFPNADEIAEEFANLSREIDEVKAIKHGKKVEPSVWSAGEQLNAIKYAREQGYITAAEAQKLTRKLLRLPGKRVIADVKQSRRVARKGR